MSKLLNHRIYIIVGILGICVVTAFFVRSCFSSRQIHATVSPLDVEPKHPIFFADSTKNAEQWLWEFGNGDSSPLPKGEYVYEEAGKYQIRLTVDGKLEKKFIVNVHLSQNDADNELIKIVAPATGIQGEYIIFRGEGSSKEWRWEFGETGAIDAREKTAIYQYSEPGTYEVQLSTEETKYPVRHTINITPEYSDGDTLDIESIIGNDIREKLQAIVDQKPFKTNYDYVLNTYLCRDPNTLVLINNTKKNDFYSYCMGLRIIGRKRTVIEKVLVDINANIDCIVKLIVIQIDTE
ncbi:MAG: PKD domain-containing protein [Prevotellaceae bacterium]|jgi:hypothetical protein|nr:PKD domain-containing protein [Prevotellaceae bacterium]